MCEGIRFYGSLWIIKLKKIKMLKVFMVVDIVFWECWGVVDKDIDVFIIYIFFYGVFDYFCYFGDLFFEFVC